MVGLDDLGDLFQSQWSYESWKHLLLWGGNTADETNISMLSKEQKQNTHMELVLCKRDQNGFSSVSPAARLWQWDFCRWNFQVFLMRHWFPPCFKGDDTNICTMNYRVFLTSDEFHQTEQISVPLKHSRQVTARDQALWRRQSSLPLCSNAEYRWNRIHAYFFPVQIMASKLPKSNS